jgi:peptide/nickel transport system permease protein
LTLEEPSPSPELGAFRAPYEGLEMLRYIAARLGQTVLIVLAVSVIVFVMTRLLPGGSAEAILGNRASPAAIAAFNRAHGLNLPIPLQYGRYLLALLHGDFGYSYKLGQPVATLIATRMPKTIFLSGVSLAIAVVISIPLGIFQAIRQSKPIDTLLTAGEFVVYSMPAFWLAIILILVFAVHLSLLPSEAPQSDSLAQILADPRALVLPIVVTTIGTVAALSRYMRSSAIENLAKEYVRTARAKGLLEWTVLFRHMARNAVIPLVTLVGLSVPALVSGSVIVETIFNFPGIGLLYDTAASDRDYPVLLAIVLVASVATALGSLLADVMYVVVNPQVRYGTKE